MSPSGDRRHVVFSFTSHGFGHLTRTLRVLDRFLELYPHVDATVCAEAPGWLIEQRVRRPVSQRRVSYEPGAAQKNCFEVDPDRTREAYQRFAGEYESRLEAEREFLRDREPLGVVVDIPALPVRAAKDCSLPVAGVSNFTWDWILEPMIREEELARLRSDYELGDLFLSLPFGPGSSPFRKTELVPLVAPSSALERGVTFQRLAFEPREGAPVVLVCVGGWGADEWPPIRVSGCESFDFIVVGDLPVETRAPTLRLSDSVGSGVDVSDIVAAADVVLTKPGYGISSECVAHQTPIVGIERRDFREFTELVRGLEAAGPFAPMSLDAFFSGSWEGPLLEALEHRRPWTKSPVDGAREVARRLGTFFELDDSSAKESAQEKAPHSSRREADSGERS